MSVDEDVIKTGPNLTPSLQLLECTADRNMSVMAEIKLPSDSSDVIGSCPVSAGLALPNHISSVDSCPNSENSGQKAERDEHHINNNNNSSIPNSKQQQHQKLSKRRNTSNYGLNHPPFGKRRRRTTSESDSVLPSNFLLGGNIFDPLNLNSLLDEEVNRALNAETPKSSPLPAKSRDPVEILIPRDITDPLNLNSATADGRVLVSPLKSGGRKRNRRHHGGGGGGGGAGTSVPPLNFTESGKSSDVTPGTSALTRGAVDLGLPVDVPQGSSTLSGVTGDSKHSKEDGLYSCKEEAAVCAPARAQSTADDVTSPAPTAAAAAHNQHSGRRKRRRNSGKTEPPTAHCGKAGPGEKVEGAPCFGTPKTGAKTGHGGRQQTPHHQQKPRQAKSKFQYGNYNKYYGYRNPGAGEDPRTRALRSEWFRGKDVLDLGCNAGHLTLYIARVLRPARILGLDIDGGLVHAARKNVRHYLSELAAPEAGRAAAPEAGRAAPEAGRAPPPPESNGGGGRGGENGEAAESGGSGRAGGDKDAARHPAEEVMGAGPDQTASRHFPVSLRITRGPIAAPPLTETPGARPGEFPSNVSFIKANYVLENDALLLTQRAEYDVILCLSVTKWVHLNWGDSGLKRLFHRAYRHLRPGGLFILEPQPWDSYVRRKKLTDNISKNYKSIRLKPDQFSAYLTTSVGFASYELIGTPKSLMKGFQRPIYLFHK